MGDAQDFSDYVLPDSVSHLLHRALQLAEERFAVLAHTSGLTLRQFAVLAAISANPGLSQADLVRATSIDRSTLADIASRLELRGFITRSRAEDQRANAVRLTAQGGALLQTTVKHAHAADAAVLDLLSPSKGKSFVATLSRLAERAEEQAAAREKHQRKAARRQARHEAKTREKDDGGRKAKGGKKKRERAERSAAKRKAPATPDDTFRPA